MNQKKQPNRIFIHKELAIKAIIDCRTTAVYKLRTRLGFKKYNVILTKEQSMLKKIKSSFEGKNMKTNYCLLEYMTIDLQYILMKMVTVVKILTMR